MTRGPERREALGWTGAPGPGGRPAAVLDLLVMIVVLTVVAISLRTFTTVPTWAAIAIGAFTAAGASRLHLGARILRALGRRR
ncbi:hypothetical protein ACF09C_22195 [Streptomyces sp. NPDC014870]|uniref:hypothetical protein n=1 Tax=Streptomyces sp. NPDC014870 TaxID=3364925 RepID=UPI0036FCD0CD